MTMHKSLLCVGGPLAGQRYETIDGAGFMVPVAPGPRPDPMTIDYQPNRPPPVELTRYRAELFQTSEGAVQFWVPCGQSQLDTMKHLLASYEDYMIPKQRAGSRSSST